MIERIARNECDSFWLALTPAELARLHDQMVRSAADYLNALAEIGAALDACQQFPDAETAGEACRQHALMTVRRHSA